MEDKRKSITVAIPCYNEEKTVAKVINDFHRELPEAQIIVFNNNSTDKTAEIAKKNGAKIVFERRRGKGYVIQKMFQTINSDIFIMVDGDDTYFANDVHKLLEPVDKKEADMVVGNRINQDRNGFSTSHHFGNMLFKYLLNYLFNAKFADILSGYRVMSKKFYKNIPLLAKGFEIETELTLQSLERDFHIKEVSIQYKDRPKGSHSKINKFKDGYRIILTIVSLLRDYRPTVFFGYVGGIFVLAGIFFGSVVLNEYITTGIIQRVPTAILSVALVLVGVNSFISGLILSAINRRHRETEIFIKQIKKQKN